MEHLESTQNIVHVGTYVWFWKYLININETTKLCYLKEQYTVRYTHVKLNIPTYLPMKIMHHMTRY